MDVACIDAGADGIELFAREGDHYFVDLFFLQYFSQLCDGSEVPAPIEFGDGVVDKPDAGIPVIIVAVDSFVKELGCVIAAHQQDFVVHFSLGEDRVDVFAVDVFGGRYDEKYKKNESQEYHQFHFHPGLQEGEAGGGEDGEEQGIVEDEDDFFRELIGAAFGVEFGIGAGKVPGDDQQEGVEVEQRGGETDDLKLPLDQGKRQ